MAFDDNLFETMRKSLCGTDTYDRATPASAPTSSVDAAGAAPAVSADAHTSPPIVSKPKPKPPPRKSTYVKPVRTSQEVIFHINAKTDSEVQAVQRELQDLAHSYYGQKQDQNDCLEYVDDADIEKIVQCQTDLAFVDLGKRDPLYKKCAFLNL